MWFKNLTLFRTVEPFSSLGEALAARLAQDVFQPCPSFQPSVIGWVPPLGRKAVDLVHAVAGRYLVCLQAEEKVLPAGVVNQMVAERIAAIEDRERRSVRRRERQELRDQLLQALMPTALVAARRSYAYLDPAAGWLVVDSASPHRVEEITGLLRKALAGLAIAPPKVKQSVTAAMTGWLAEGRPPAGFEFADSCELREPGEAGGVVRCRGQDLTGDEIHSHLVAGKQVAQLGLRWRERIEFVLDEALVVRRLKFLDVVHESLGQSATDSLEAIFDAEYALMTGELALLLPDLLALFGGEA